MASTILQILMWAIPSGGIGAAIAWIANKNVRQAKTAKEVHDTYKTMYADVSDVLIKLQKENEQLNGKVDELTKENEKTRRSLNRLCRAIEAIQLCPHSAACPVRNELSLTDDDDKSASGSKNRHASANVDGGANDAKSNTHSSGESDAVSINRQPAKATERRSIRGAEGADEVEGKSK